MVDLHPPPFRGASNSATAPGGGGEEEEEEEEECSSSAHASPARKMALPAASQLPAPQKPSSPHSSRVNSRDQSPLFAAGGRSQASNRTLPSLRTVVGGSGTLRQDNSSSSAVGGSRSPRRHSPSTALTTSSLSSSPQHHVTNVHQHLHRHNQHQRNQPSHASGSKSYSQISRELQQQQNCRLPTDSSLHPGVDRPDAVSSDPAFLEIPSSSSSAGSHHQPSATTMNNPVSSTSSSSSSSPHVSAAGHRKNRSPHRSPRRFPRHSRQRRDDEGGEEEEGCVEGLGADSAHIPLDDCYPLHDAVFHGDVRRVAHILRAHQVQVGAVDIHGNTPLHIAVAMGRKDCIQLLLSHNSPIKLKNTQGWSSLSEAVSYGDRQTILCLLRKLKSQSREALEARRPDLIQALTDMGDFYMELKWDFQSWVPFLSRILPSDICKIHKKGSSMRLDTTLVDFSDMRWERGDLTFLFNGRAKPTNSLVVMDNQLKVYQMIRYEETEAELEEEVDILMSSDIVAVQMSTKAIQLDRAQSGWLFRKDRSELIGAFKADVYSVHGLVVDSKKRREHLSEEDLQKNKAIFESFSKGRDLAETQLEGQPIRRPCLEKPPPTKITWEEYINAPTGKPPYLGRPVVCKNQNKSFKAYLAISRDFPIDFARLLDVLEVVAPFKHFNKLREFVQLKLPPGFPVQIEIPIFPTIVAKVTFQEFVLSSGEEPEVSPNLFEIPVDYREDPNRFPDL